LTKKESGGGTNGEHFLIREKKIRGGDLGP